MYTINVTGHRPNKLWGYNLNHPGYVCLEEWFKRYLVTRNCTDAWTGMALGVDTVFAHAVLNLRDNGYDIKLHCAIPCQGHSSLWVRDSQIEYDQILKLADEVVLVSNEPYSPKLMQIRNEFMVDRSNETCAIWDGTSGGTKNCVDYAVKKCKYLTVLHPNQFFQKS